MKLLSSFSTIQTNHQEDNILSTEVLSLKWDAFLEDALYYSYSFYWSKNQPHLICFRHCAASEKQSVQVLPHRVHKLGQTQDRHVECTCRINNMMTANMLIGLIFWLIVCFAGFSWEGLCQTERQKNSEESTSVSGAEVQWLRKAGKEVCNGQSEKDKSKK